VRNSSLKFRYCPNGRKFNRASPTANHMLRHLELATITSIVRIKKEAKDFGGGNDVMQELHSLLNKMGRNHRDPGAIAPRPSNARDQTQLHRVNPVHEHYWDRRGCSLGGTRWQIIANSHDYRNSPAC